MNGQLHLIVSPEELHERPQLALHRRRARELTNATSVRFHSREQGGNPPHLTEHPRVALHVGVTSETDEAVRLEAAR